MYESACVHAHTTKPSRPSQPPDHQPCKHPTTTRLPDHPASHAHSMKMRCKSRTRHHQSAKETHARQICATNDRLLLWILTNVYCAQGVIQRGFHRDTRRMRCVPRALTKRAMSFRREEGGKNRLLRRDNTFHTESHRREPFMLKQCKQSVVCWGQTSLSRCRICFFLTHPTTGGKWILTEMPLLVVRPQRHQMRRIRFGRMCCWCLGVSGSST